MDGGPAEPQTQDPPRRRRGGRRRRQDPTTARSELLAAGLELVSERSLGDTLGHLRINDVARAAGLTSGAFYHYWDGQDAYRDDVLDAVLAADRVDAAADLFAAAGDPAAPLDALRRAVNGAAERLAADPEHRLELALWAHDDPAVARRLLTRARRTDAAWAAALGAFLASAGRRPAPGWDLARLATAAVALSDGLRSLALIDPDALTGVPRPDGWSVPALLALLLLVGATEDGEPEPVPEAPAALTVGTEGDSPKRRRLVDLGVAAVRAQPTGNAFDHIRADDVARRLGLTIGAFYHYWESQEDYRDDLVDALFAAERYVDPDMVAASARRVTEAEDLEAAVRETTTRYWIVTAGHPDNRVQFTVQALDDPYIGPRQAAWNAELRRSWQAVLDALLGRFGRSCRPPLDPSLVVLAMSATLDGLIVRHGLDPAGLGPDGDGWTLWGRACRALVTGASSPAGDTRSLLDLGEAAFGP